MIICLLHNVFVGLLMEMPALAHAGQGKAVSLLCHLLDPICGDARRPGLVDVAAAWQAYMFGKPPRHDACSKPPVGSRSRGQRIRTARRGHVRDQPRPRNVRTSLFAEQTTATGDPAGTQSAVSTITKQGNISDVSRLWSAYVPNVLLISRHQSQATLILHSIVPFIPERSPVHPHSS